MEVEDSMLKKGLKSGDRCTKKAWKKAFWENGINFVCLIEERVSAILRRY